MGFLSGLGRLVQGKPVFEAADQQGQAQSAPVQASGEKIVPKVYIVRSDCRVNSGHMELTVHIKNESEVEVFVDNIRIFDKVVEIDRIVKPAETSDFEVYNGPVMTDERKNKCELKYRKTDGDFFVMQHFVDYGFRNNTYVVDSIKPAGPVNDI